MLTRSTKVNIIPRIYTKSVVSLDFAKSVDSQNDLNNLLLKSEEILNKHGCVIISMVIPDSYYKGWVKNEKKIHQAHTFALTRNKTHLLLYDISNKNSYYSDEEGWDNYKSLIDSLRGRRKIIFFSLKYAKKKSLQSVKYMNQEGICFTPLEI